MMMDEWRRRLLQLMQAERAARDRVNQRPDPLAAEQAYQELRAAEAALEHHYGIRPQHA